MDTLNDILNQLGNLGVGAQVVLAVIVSGYLVKGSPIPNWIIPFITLAVAITTNIMLGNPGAIDYDANPSVRLGFGGVAYWAFGWLLHNQGLSRLEKFLPAPLRSLIGAEPKPEPRPEEQKP